MTHPIPVAILGPTGYTGLELLEILATHPSMRAAYLGSARSEPVDITREFPRLAGRLGDGVSSTTRPIDAHAIARECRLAFLCLPHDAAMKHVPTLLAAGVMCVDLSAAYRIKDAAVYAKFYGHEHTDPVNLANAVYGLTEFYREAIRSATLVANPGCYPTAAAMAITPFLKAGAIRPDSIIINAASGASGAGRDAKPHLTIVEAGDNFSAYGLGNHRHQPEIEQSLRNLGGDAGKAASALFLPHLLPVERGILETITAECADAKMTSERAQEILRRAYSNEPFVVVREDSPTLRDVQKTNRVHINARVVGERTARTRLVIVAAIDNLMKGASGQAVQNAHLMLGLDERAGLN